MNILPVEYGIAGYLSVTRDRASADDSEAINAAMLSAAAQELVRERSRPLKRALSSANADLSYVRAINARLLERLSEGIRMEAQPAETGQEAVDLEALRRENLALRTSLEWHVSELAIERS